MESQTSFPRLPEQVAKLLNKKEFIQYKTEINKPDTAIDKQLYRENVLMLHAHQMFVLNLLNPVTPYNRCLFKHNPGSGKTIAALIIANEFIKNFRYAFPENQGKIFIIGFTKTAFQNELLSRPEFGIINSGDLGVLSRLRKIALSGTEKDMQMLQNFEIQLKKRLSQNATGRYYKIFGYKGFFNKLFTVIPGQQMDITSKSESEIFAAIKSGAIQINRDLILGFRNSLVIMDEIHDVYNSKELNNYGIALKTLFNIYDDPESMVRSGYLRNFTEADIGIIQYSLLKAILMSATPINNSPTEIVDLFNLLVPITEITKFITGSSASSRIGTIPDTDKSGNDRGLIKSDFFSSDRDLIPGRLDEFIHKHLVGRVSFLQDDNPKFFPRKIFHGTQIPIPASLRKFAIKHGGNINYIPYVKFVRSVMSDLQSVTTEELNNNAVPTDSYAIMDMVFPNPSNPRVGIYKNKDLKASYRNADPDWLRKTGVDIRMSGKNMIISGDFLHVDRVGKYSTKYARLLNDIFDNLASDGGKILISHQYVKSSGVLLIQELLRMNGIIDEFGNPNEDTRCAVCGRVSGKHKAQTANSEHTHIFMPARFICYHGEIQPGIAAASFEKYNNPGNLNGHKYKIFIGSELINQSKNFNYVRSLHILHIPNDFSTLIQIIGRAARKNSHKELAPNLQHVNIFIYTSGFGSGLGRPHGPDNEKDNGRGSNHGKNDGFSTDRLSPEEFRYFDKSQDYLVIQEIERMVNQIAIDSITNRNVVETSLIKPGETTELGTLYFDIDPVYEKINIRDKPNTDTFNLYNNDEEIRKIIYITKRLFLEISSCWTYEDLWAAVRDPPFNAYVDAGLFDEDNFRIVLHFLVNENSYLSYNLFEGGPRASPGENSGDDSGDNLLALVDSENNRIVKAGVEYRIVNVNEFFIMFPTSNNQNTFDKLGVNIYDSIPVIVEEDWYRQVSLSRFNKIYISDYLQMDKSDFYVLKYNFYNTYRDTPIDEIPNSFENYDIGFHIRLCEDCIVYVFNVLTDSSMQTSELHNFYLKMLYFYDTMGVLVFADDLIGSEHLNIYKKYLLPDNPDMPGRPSGRDLKYQEFIRSEKYNNFLMSTFAKRVGSFSFNPGRINEYIGKKINATINPKIENMNLSNYLYTRNSIKRTYAKILPVGHFLYGGPNGESNTLKLYDPESPGSQVRWINIRDFNNFYNTDVEENDIIIGYYEKVPGNINLKFKLRSPIVRIMEEQTSDIRTRERGAICTTKKKEELLRIVKQLDIDTDNNNNAKNLCNIICNELIYRELQSYRKYRHYSDAERKTKKQVKWFYMFYEPQPSGF